MVAYLFVSVGLLAATGVSTIWILVSGHPIKDRGAFQIGVVLAVVILYGSIISHFHLLTEGIYVLPTFGRAISFFLPTVVATATNVPFIAYVVSSLVLRSLSGLTPEIGGGSEFAEPDTIARAVRAGDYRRAEELLVASIQEKPSNIDARLRLAGLYTKLGRTADAAYQYDRVAQMRNEEKSLPAALKLAELAIEGKANPEIARRLLSQNLCDFPRSKHAERAKRLLELLAMKGGDKES